MKKTIFIFIIFILAGFAFSRDYNIEEKQIHVESKTKKYEINITYPQISVLSENRGSEIRSYYGFNSFVRTRMEARRDSFIVWMNDREINEFNKDFSSEYEIFDSVYYADNNLISILFSEYSYFAGAAHPNNWNFTINYDLENSKEVFLKDMLNSGWETRISEICIAEITKQKKENGIEPDEWVKDGAGPDAENFKVFNITTEGLLITFPTYQVGAYVEGPSDVEIPYNSIKELIKPGSILYSLAK